MFTIKFETYLDTENPDDTTRILGTHFVEKPMRLPYVPRIGEAVKFGIDGMDDDDMTILDVSEVVLNTAAGEIEVYLEGFRYDPADVDPQLAHYEKLGFKLISYEPFEHEPEEVSEEAHQTGGE